MATVQQPAAKVAVPPYEVTVDQTLTAATRRLRGLEFGYWTLILGGLILTYGLTVSCADLMWELPALVRQVAWCLLVAAIGVLLYATVTKVWLRRLNPLFLARQLEQTIPHAKNSVINWLDLRREPLAPVIRGSLGRRAAKDIGHADAERAFSAQPLWWLGSIAAVLLVIQLGWLLSAPSQVSSLLKRAFFPFESSTIALRTALTLLTPTGDATVPANKPVIVRVQAEGYVPALNQKDSLKLHFRHQQDEYFEERALQRDVDGLWTTTVLADQVRTGFWYKITGGDARLPQDGEYRIQVASIPQVLRFEATFKYRDYLRAKDRTTVLDKNRRPAIKELRGTAITLTLRTNSILQHCALELTSGGVKKLLPGEAVAGDAEAWRFQWVLDKSGEFRVLFSSKEGDKNVDRQPIRFEVIPERAPEVVLTKPAQDITLPTNGTLYVEGHAGDDFGVKSMQLNLKLLKAPTLAALKPKPYRPEVSFLLPNGKYPLRLEYSDWLALNGVQTAAGELFALTAGMELEYWIEARDNCDYPDKAGNLGQSTRYKLLIGPPESNNQAAAQDRQDKQQQAQNKQNKQDKSLNDQKMQAQAEQDAAGGGGGQQGNDKKDQSDLDKQAQQVKDAMNDADKPGSSKPDDQPKGESKDKGPQDGSGSDAKSNPPENKDSAGQEKDKGSQGQGNEAGKGKDEGKNQAGNDAGQPDSKAGDAKDKGNPGASKDEPGNSKGGDPKGGADSAKSETKQGAKDDNPSAAKGQQGQGDSPEISKDKGPGDKGGDKSAKAPPLGGVKSATPTDKAAPKDAPTIDEQVAGAKGGDAKGQPAPPDAKMPPADPSQTAGTSKAADRKDATLDDVAKLREKLGDAAMRDLVQKELEKIGDQAGKDDVRKAAEKALQEAKEQPGVAKQGDPALDKTSGKADDKGPGAAGQKQTDTGAAKNAQPKSDTAKSKEGVGPDKGGASAKTDPRKQDAGTAGAKNPGVKSPEEIANPNPIDEAAARRAGELQLETVKQQIDKLRDKFTPEVMKKLNWSDGEREEFLRKMTAEALLRQQQQKISPDKLPLPGAIPSLLPAAGPRPLQPATGDGNTPPALDNPEAPPGVRDALQRFINNTKK